MNKIALYLIAAIIGIVMLFGNDIIDYGDAVLIMILALGFTGIIEAIEERKNHE